jgi:hypothetical protein
VESFLNAPVVTLGEAVVCSKKRRVSVEGRINEVIDICEVFELFSWKYTFSRSA